MVSMKRATISFSDDLSEAVEEYRKSLELPASLTAVVQAALQEYLQARGFQRPYKALRITSKGSSGRSDVSQNHDMYLAGLKK